MDTSETSLAQTVPAPASKKLGYDLLRLRPVNLLFRWIAFPYIFQAALLVVFVGFALFSWGVHAPTGVPSKIFAKSHLVTLLVWGLWWPSMVWVAVLLGRAWCMICPLELVANGTERLARLLRVPQRRLGKWLRAGWLIIALYALIQMLVAGIQLHRVPAYTSVFLWGLIGTAALVGFFFKDRAFCRGFCPVGLLLGTYGRGSMLAVRPMAAGTCSSCTDRGCMRSCNRTKLDARSCPSLLNPARLDSNADCLVCGQCFKSCGPNNLGLLLRPPFHPDDARERLASWPITLFVMLVSGFVIYELFSEWKSAQAVFLQAPRAVTSWLGAAAYGGWIKGVWTLFVVPLVVWLVLGGVLVASRGAGSLTEAWRRLALPLAVLIAAGHMAKGLAKFASWVGYLPGALDEPSGVNQARAIATGTLQAPGKILPLVTVSVVGVLLLLVATYLALRELRLAQGDASRRYRAPVFLLASFFLVLVFGWGFLQ